MKISFPKYDGQLQTRKQGATKIISFVGIVFFTGACGTYLLANKIWLLTIAGVGIAGILLFLGAATAISVKQSKVEEAPSFVFQENESITAPHWDYRPQKPVRRRLVLHSPSTKTSESLSRDPSEIDDNAWLTANSIEGADPALIDGALQKQERTAKTLSGTTDRVRSAPTVQDASVST